MSNNTFLSVRQNSQAATSAYVSPNSALFSLAFSVQFHAVAPLTRLGLPIKLRKTQIHPCFQNERGVAGVSVADEMSWTLVSGSALIMVAASPIGNDSCHEAGWILGLDRMLEHWMVWVRLVDTLRMKFRRQAQKMRIWIMQRINVSSFGVLV
jgi:hypothetical protein